MANAPQQNDRTVVLAARVLIASLMCAILYLGRAVFIPLALAALFGFALHPVVKKLQRWRVPRSAAVALTVSIATVIAGGASWLIAGQLASFTRELPDYQRNISTKIGEAQALLRGGTLEKLQETIENVAQEAKQRHADGSPNPPQETRPLPVVIESPGQWLGMTMANTALPLLQPLATSGLVFILVILMLLRWEDLRSRLISFIDQDITTSTRAIDEAGSRITRYLAMQFLLNGSIGLVAGLGLWMLGVPHASLWGLCAGLFRYVPYAGPFIAALIPLLVSMVTSTGWSQVTGVLALFVTIELICNNFLEPWLYGWRLGLSELGVIIATVAWTFLWGPAGLMLATPVTVCLVVLGEHIPALALFSRILGDKSAMPLHLRFYQRLLARDQIEVVELAHRQMTDKNVADVCREYIAPALIHARSEQAEGTLSSEECAAISEAVGPVIESLSALEKATDTRQPDAATEFEPVPVVLWPMCALGESALPVIEHLCADLPCQWRVIPSSSLSAEILTNLADFQEPPVVACLLCLHENDLMRVRSLCKRLRAASFATHITVACWGEVADRHGAGAALQRAGASDIAWTPAETRTVMAPHILNNLQPRRKACQSNGGHHGRSPLGDLLHA